MTNQQLLNENGLMVAIIEKNNIIMNQGQLLDERNKEISELKAKLKELEGGE